MKKFHVFCCSVALTVLVCIGYFMMYISFKIEEPIGIYLGMCTAGAALSGFCSLYNELNRSTQHNGENL